MSSWRQVLVTGLAALLLAVPAMTAGPDDETPPVQPGDEDTMPVPDEEAADIMTTVEDDGGLTMLAALLHVSGLDSLLSGDGQFTLFAPDDSAFGELTAAQRDELQTSREAARKLLEHHIVKGTALEFEETGEMTVKTMDGQELAIAADYEEVTVGSATILDEGIWCTNGIIHVIDGVLRPKSAAGKSN